MQRKIKSILSKINFLLGNNPEIENNSRQNNYIPENYHAVITITADFELAWASRFSKFHDNPVENAKHKARVARKNIPFILSFCEKYSIPITWATVGHLFLEQCDAHHDLTTIPFFENQFWKFKRGGWYDADPGSNYKDAPEWYAPDLIKKILNSKIKHEIGCHTFSHIDCSDALCPSEVFRDEIDVCIEEADKNNLSLRSFVHPGHTLGNFITLKDKGFTSYQSDIKNTLGYPNKDSSGLWELKRTYEFAFKPDWSIDYHTYRYIEIIKRALKSKSVCNFWFHPSFNPLFVEKVMPEVFSFIDQNRDLLFVTTVGDYVDFLNQNDAE